MHFLAITFTEWALVPDKDILRIIPIRSYGSGLCPFLIYFFNTLR